MSGFPGAMAIKNLGRRIIDSSVGLTSVGFESCRFSSHKSHFHPLRHRHGLVGWQAGEPQSRLALPLNLTLIRHGESEGNLAQRASKKGDESLWLSPGFSNRYTSNYRLTSKGRDQAKKSGRWLLANFPELSLTPSSGPETNARIRYYCSEYIRAQETAANLGLPHAQWTVSFALREREKGVGYGSSNAERQKRQEAGSPVSITWADLYRFKDS